MIGFAALAVVALLARWLGSCSSYDGQGPEGPDPSSTAPIMIGIVLSALLVAAILAGCAHARRRAEPRPASVELSDVVEQVGYVGEQLWAAAIRRNQRFFTIYTATGATVQAPLDWRMNEKWSVVWMSGGDDRSPDQIVIGDASGRQVLLLRWRQ